MTPALRGQLVLLALGLVVSFGLAAQDAPPDALAEVPLRRIWLQDRSQLPAGEWTTVPRAEFERVWEASRRREAAPPRSADCLALRCRYWLEGDVLRAEGALEIDLNSTPPTALRLEPWSLGWTRRATVNGTPVVAATTEGGQGIEVLLEQAGRETLRFTGSQRGTQVDGGLRYQIDWPIVPLAQHEIWLPDHLRPVPLDGRLEFHPLALRDGAGRLGWRCLLTGPASSSMQFALRPAADLIGRFTPVSVQLATEYTLTHQGLEVQWTLEAEKPAVRDEWIFALEDGLTLTEIIDVRHQRRLTWRPAGPDQSGLIAVRLAPGSGDRHLWRIRGIVPGLPKWQGTPERFRLAGLTPHGVHRCDEVIDLRVESSFACRDWDLGDYQATDWAVAEQTEAGSWRRHRFQRQTRAGLLPPRRPSATLQRAQSPGTAYQQLWLHLEPEQATLVARIEVTEPLDSHSVQVQLPVDWDLVEIEATDAALPLTPTLRTDVATRLLTVQSGRPLLAPTLRLRLRRPLPPANAAGLRELRFPWVAPRATQETISNVAVSVARATAFPSVPLLAVEPRGAESWPEQPPPLVGEWRAVAATPDYFWLTRRAMSDLILEIKELPTRWAGATQTHLSPSPQGGHLEYRLRALPQAGVGQTLSLQFSEPPPAALAWRVTEGDNRIAAYRRLDETRAEIVLERPVIRPLEVRADADWQPGAPVPLLRWPFAPVSMLVLSGAEARSAQVRAEGSFFPLDASAARPTLEARTGTPQAEPERVFRIDATTRRVAVALAPGSTAPAATGPWQVEIGSVDWQWAAEDSLVGAWRLGLPPQAEGSLALDMGPNELLSVVARNGDNESALAWSRQGTEVQFTVPSECSELRLTWQTSPRWVGLGYLGLLECPRLLSLQASGAPRETLAMAVGSPITDADWVKEGGVLVRQRTAGTQATVLLLVPSGMAVGALGIALGLVVILYGLPVVAVLVALLGIVGASWGVLNLAGLPAWVAFGLGCAAAGTLGWRVPTRGPLAAQAGVPVSVLTLPPAPAFGDRLPAYVLRADAAAADPQAQLMLVPSEPWRQLLRRVDPTTLRDVWPLEVEDQCAWDGTTVRAVTQAVFQVRAESATWPLRLQVGQRLRYVRLNGQECEVEWKEGQPWLAFASSGLQQLEIAWEAVPSDPATPRVVNQLVSAPVHRVRWTVPSDAVAQFRHGSHRSLLRADLESICHLGPGGAPWTLAWSPTARRPDVRARAVHEIGVAPEGITLRSLLTFTWPSGQLTECSLLWPRAWMVKALEIPTSGPGGEARIAGWSWEPWDHDHDRLRVTLTEPASSELRLLIEAALHPLALAKPIWPGPADLVQTHGHLAKTLLGPRQPARLQLELPRAAGALLDEDIILLQAQRLQAEVEGAGTPLSQPGWLRGSGMRARQAFRRPAGEQGPLLVTLTAATPAVVTRQEMTFERAGTDWIMLAEADVNVPPGQTADLRFRAPPGTTITSVTGSQVRGWELRADGCRIWLSAPNQPTTSAQVRVRGWTPFEVRSEDQEESGFVEGQGPGFEGGPDLVVRFPDSSVDPQTQVLESQLKMEEQGGDWHFEAELRGTALARLPLELTIRSWPGMAAMEWDGSQPFSVLARPKDGEVWNVRVNSSAPLSWLRLRGRWPGLPGEPAVPPRIEVVDGITREPQLDLRPGTSSNGLGGTATASRSLPLDGSQPFFTPPESPPASSPLAPRQQAGPWWFAVAFLAAGGTKWVLARGRKPLVRPALPS